MKYDVCIMGNIPTSDKPVVVQTVIVDADNINAAYIAADAMQKGAFRVYPHADTHDTDSIHRLADYAHTHYWKWELANENAALAALNRSTWDKEDERQTAVLAVWEVLANGGSSRDAYTRARRALDAERHKLSRKNEREYNPEWAFHSVFTDWQVRNTFPRLAALIADAVEHAPLTEKQREVLSMVCNGIAPKDIAERLAIKRHAYYGHIAAAKYKVLSYAVLADGENAPTFAACGIDAATVVETLAELRSKAQKLNKW